MSETLTGRTRLRAARDYGSQVLVIQVEVTFHTPAGDGGSSSGLDAFWRDAKIEDVTAGGTEQLHAILERYDAELHRKVIQQLSTTTATPIS